MEKPDIELQKLEIEKIKVSIERGKIIEGQIRTLVIVLIAVVGGVRGGKNGDINTCPYLDAWVYSHNRFWTYGLENT